MSQGDTSESYFSVSLGGWAWVPSISYQTQSAGLSGGLRRLPPPGAVNLSVHVWTYDFFRDMSAFHCSYLSTHSPCDELYCMTIQICMFMWHMEVHDAHTSPSHSLLLESWKPRGFWSDLDLHFKFYLCHVVAL